MDIIFKSNYFKNTSFVFAFKIDLVVQDYFYTKQYMFFNIWPDNK